MLNKFIVSLLIFIAAQDWYLYTSSELNFSILFPVQPQVQTKNIKTDLGTIEQTTAFLKNQDSTGIEFQIIVSKYNPELFEGSESDSLKQLIQFTIVKEMESFLKGEIIYENAAELKGQNCYWFLIKYKGHSSLKCCLLWDDENLISLIHYSDFDKRLSSNSDRFFNSFTFLSKK